MVKDAYMIPSFWKMESHLIDVPLVLCIVQIHVLDDCYVRSDDGGKNSKAKSEIWHAKCSSDDDEDKHFGS